MFSFISNEMLGMEEVSKPLAESISVILFCLHEVYFQNLTSVPEDGDWDCKQSRVKKTNHQPLGLLLHHCNRCKPVQQHEFKRFYLHSESCDHIVS